MQTLQEYFKSLPDFKPPFFKPLSVVAELDQEFRSPDSLWREPLRTLKIPVPTLRVTHKRLQCDITFSNGLGVENTRLLHHMFSLQPEAFKLYHFVRIWIHIDEFAFKRYMVALLVVFYLQNKNLMPSVLKMQEDTGEKFIAGFYLQLFKISEINWLLCRLERWVQLRKKVDRLWNGIDQKLHWSSYWLFWVLREFQFHRQRHMSLSWTRNSRLGLSRGRWRPKKIQRQHQKLHQSRS